MPGRTSYRSSSAGHPAQAIVHYEQAVRLKPDYAGAHSNLGNALGAQNKLEEAIPHYRKALEIDPKDYQTQFNLGVSLLRQGRKPEAKAHFQEALRLRPDYPEALQALAGLNSGVEQKVHRAGHPRDEGARGK